MFDHAFRLFEPARPGGCVWQNTEIKPLPDSSLAEMCGTSNQYSISDISVRQLVSAFRDATHTQNNPLGTDRWFDIIQYGDANDAGFRAWPAKHAMLA